MAWRPVRSSARVGICGTLDALSVVGYATGLAGVGEKAINLASEALMPSEFDLFA